MPRLLGGDVEEEDEPLEFGFNSAREERQRREEAERQRQQQRRARIQAVKRAVGVLSSASIEDTIRSLSAPRAPSDEAKTRALQAIEKELSEMSVEELPLEELVEIAREIVTRVYRSVEETQARTQRDEDARLRREQDQHEHIRSLVAYGRNYAREVLREEEVPLEEWWDLLGTVERAVEEEVGEDSDQGEVEGIVEEVLDEELADDENDDESAP